jgi:hypothetical protein
MNGDPAAAAGTDNHPEDGGGPGAGAIHRLRKGEAVGIVCHPHRLAKLLHDIPAQIVTVEHQAVAVFNAPLCGSIAPGRPIPGERLRADRANIGNQGQQLTHKGVIALCGSAGAGAGRIRPPGPAVRLPFWCRQYLFQDVT